MNNRDLKISSRAWCMPAWLCLGIMIGLPACASADNWSGFGGPDANFAASVDEAMDAEHLQPTARWQIELGDGLSSAVVYDDTVYVSYLSADRDPDSDKRAQTEVLTAIRRADGTALWAHRWDAGWRDDQEAFGGKPRAPQATPLVTADSIVTLGFTGWLHCLDRRTGELRWQTDLVENFEATPVQFGYSGSPVLCDGKLVVLAGGKKGGLVAFSLPDGEVIWNVPCDEASYATPVVWTVGNSKQIVFVTRDDIIGAAADDGVELWRYALPETGMTNVPTPLPLGEGRLAVSGQGIQGTRELIVSQQNGQWNVDEGWTSDVQFFYCNWLLSNGRILGCNGNLLVAIDADTGQRVGRWRGFEDANIVRSGDRYLVLDGKGALSIMQPSTTGFEILGRYQVMDERCWTPISLAGSDIFCRGGSTLACCVLTSEQESSQTRLEPLRVRKKSLKLQSLASDDSNEAAEMVEPVEQVVAAFEADGATAAWKTYLKLRAKGLTLDQREELAELAMQQGLVDFGKQLLQHAVDDLGVEVAGDLQRRMLEKWDVQPSNKKETAENGLVYLEIGIKNSSDKTIQTVVRGPEKHPFSYGIPFPSGKLRIERWPVGTKLFAAKNEVAGKVLLEVAETDAGQIIQIGK